MLCVVGGMKPLRVTNSFCRAGRRLPWSHLHIGTLPRLISFVCRSYENCRVCTQNSRSGTHQSPLISRPLSLIESISSTADQRMELQIARAYQSLSKQRILAAIMYLTQTEFFV